MGRKTLKEKESRGLVLTLKEGEAVALNGGELLIYVKHITGTRVRLVFQGDREIKINRQQLLANLH